MPRYDGQKLTTDGDHFGLIGKTADEPFRSPLADQGQPEHDRATSQRGGTEYLAHARGLAGTHVLRGDRRAGECHSNGRQEDRLHHRSEEHTSELQSLMRMSYAVFCLKNKTHMPLSSPSSSLPIAEA